MTSSYDHDDARLARMYDRISDQQFEGGKRLVERLGIGAGARVLDLGCGTGRLARHIAEEASSFGNFIRMVPEPLHEALRADLVTALDHQRGPNGIDTSLYLLLFVAERSPQGLA